MRLSTLVQEYNAMDKSDIGAEWKAVADSITADPKKWVDDSIGGLSSTQCKEGVERLNALSNFQSLRMVPHVAGILCELYGESEDKVSVLTYNMQIIMKALTVAVLTWLGDKKPADMVAAFEKRYVEARVEEVRKETEKEVLARLGQQQHQQQGMEIEERGAGGGGSGNFVNYVFFYIENCAWLARFNF